MADIIKKLGKLFPKSELSPQDFRIDGDCYLRFELGDDLENGTKPRVDQAVMRAEMLFEQLFRQDDEAWLLESSMMHRNPEIKCCFDGERIELRDLIDGFDSLEVTRCEKFIEESKEILHEDGVVRMTDCSHTWIVDLLKQPVGKIDYENLFRGIANVEMGFEPFYTRRTYFFNERNGAIFFMYDDRGCMMFAEDRKVLQPIYEAFNEWLVDYDRPWIDDVFA